MAGSVVGRAPDAGGAEGNLGRERAEQLIEEAVEAIVRRDLERHGLDPHGLDGGVP